MLKKLFGVFLVVFIFLEAIKSQKRNLDSSPHIGSSEQIYIQETFDTN